MGKGKRGGKRRNEQRLGGIGGALSLAAFANAKSRNTGYNPALIRIVCTLDLFVKLRLKEAGDDAKDAPRPHDKMKKRTSQSLNVEYEKKRVEDEKAKKEHDAIIQAKKEEREKSEAKRKELREKLFRRTRSGQPVMKYRIEHLLETAIGSSNK
ncbi:hypothetical protein ACQ4PT_063071 [Festuca glaucescens]